MTIESDKCENFNQDLITAVSLVKRDIFYAFIKIFLSIFVIIFLIKHANNFNISLKLEITVENIIALITFLLELKILSDLKESFSKLKKIKTLSDEIKKNYPNSLPQTCESQTCYMMMRVMQGTLN